MKFFKRVFTISLAFIFSFILVTPSFAASPHDPILVPFSKPDVDYKSGLFVCSNFVLYMHVNDLTNSVISSSTGQVSYTLDQDSLQFYYTFTPGTYNNNQGHFLRWFVFNNTPFDLDGYAAFYSTNGDTPYQMSSFTVRSYSSVGISNQRFIVEGSNYLYDKGFYTENFEYGSAYAGTDVTPEVTWQVRAATVIWGDELCFFNVINSIYNELHTIQTDDSAFFEDAIEYLQRILNELDLLNTYDTHAKIVFIQSQLQTWLWTTYPEYFSILSGKLDHIIDLLGGNEEITTVDPSVGENVSDRVNELESLESQVNRDYSNDISFAFGSSDQVFHGNNAFSWISSQIQSIILDNPVLSAVVIFSLAMGIAVLALGRRINV